MTDTGTSVGRTVGKVKTRGSVLDTLYLQCQGGMDLELGVGYRWEKEPRPECYIWEFVNTSMAERLNEMTKSAFKQQRGVQTLASGTL